MFRRTILIAGAALMLAGCSKQVPSAVLTSTWIVENQPPAVSTDVYTSMDKCLNAKAAVEQSAVSARQQAAEMDAQSKEFVRQELEQDRVEQPGVLIIPGTPQMARLRPHPQPMVTAICTEQ